jgi:protein phosphatase
MRIVEWASRTDDGRVRPHNEDALLVQPPLFVVADGVGGAQAGELASRLTVEAFADESTAEDAEERLRERIVEANRRVHERSQADPSAAGMGSTVVAALAHGSSVSFGHVGDSRIYLLRGGRLQQLSRDHSLVGELVRQGRLTAEEAEVHPHRSVITRALGAPTVEVDVWTIEAQDGDVYLLCSDGLSDYVPGSELARQLAGDRLEAAVDSLVQAANEAGGDDNITAVVFRLALESADAPGEETAPTPVVPEEAADGVVDEDTLTEADRVPLIADHQPPTRLLEAVYQEPRRKHPWRLAIGLTVLVLLAAAAVTGSIIGLRYSHFIGVDPQTGDVAVFQGVPVELGGGHNLYHLTFRSSVPATMLTAAERRRLFDHSLRSSSDAERIVRQLQASMP